MYCNTSKKKLSKNVFSPTNYKSYIQNFNNEKNRKRKKIGKNDFHILKYNEYPKLLEYDYKVNQLKEICKYYNQKKIGNKEQITNRVYNYLRLSYYSNVIQKIWRGILHRRYIDFHGPGFKNRNLCNNVEDFFSMESLNDIKGSNFFSYQDINSKIYGFDVKSFYNLLIKKTDKYALNPYTREKITHTICENFARFIRYSKILNIPLELEIRNEHEHLEPQKKMEFAVLELFQRMDNLGNYTNTSWFLTLNKNLLIRYLRELNDIWHYRAELSQDTKRDICPPHGNPFLDINMNMLMNMEEISLQEMIIYIMQKLVYSGINIDSKTLGAYYVLAALTLVNEEAANAMPWLYQSVAQF